MRKPRLIKKEFIFMHVSQLKSNILNNLKINNILPRNKIRIKRKNFQDFDTHFITRKQTSFIITLTGILAFPTYNTFPSAKANSGYLS